MWKCMRRRHRSSRTDGSTSSERNLHATSPHCPKSRTVYSREVDKNQREWETKRPSPSKIIPSEGHEAKGAQRSHKTALQQRSNTRPKGRPPRDKGENPQALWWPKGQSHISHMSAPLRPRSNDPNSDHSNYRRSDHRHRGDEDSSPPSEARIPAKATMPIPYDWYVLDWCPT